MKKIIDSFEIFGTKIEQTVQFQIDELVIYANSDTLTELGKFLISTAKRMKSEGIEHSHLQDEFKHFSDKKHVDIILCNKDKIVKRCPKKL